MPNRLYTKDEILSYCSEKLCKYIVHMGPLDQKGPILMYATNESKQHYFGSWRTVRTTCLSSKITTTSIPVTTENNESLIHNAIDSFLDENFEGAFESWKKKLPTISSPEIIPDNDKIENKKDDLESVESENYVSISDVVEITSTTTTTSTTTSTTTTTYTPPLEIEKVDSILNFDEPEFTANRFFQNIYGRQNNAGNYHQSWNKRKQQMEAQANAQRIRNENRQRYRVNFLNFSFLVRRTSTVLSVGLDEPTIQK